MHEKTRRMTLRRTSLYRYGCRGKGCGVQKSEPGIFWSGNREGISPWAFGEKHMLWNGMDLMIHSGREGPFEPRITIFRDTRLKNLLAFYGLDISNEKNYVV